MEKKKYDYPQVVVIDMESNELMKDFINFSLDEVVPGPPVNPNPDNGVGTDDALVKGYSVWDEE